MRKCVGSLIRKILSERTVCLLRFDLQRLWTRLRRRGRRARYSPYKKLHLGCGGRKVEGWVNIDIVGSDYDVDFTDLPLPWKDESFECVVSQQVIEHLDLERELLPLLGDIARMMKPDGEVWLCCPDMDKVCRGYLEDRGKTLYLDAMDRGGIILPEGMPVQHYINDIFHQDGTHKNLFDFELLKWTLLNAGFASCERTCEGELLERFPEFPKRGDDVQSIYVKARKSSR